MSHNSFGHLFRVTTWGESHGPAIGCIVDGCPPRMELCEADIQPWLDVRRPGSSRLVTQRQEPDRVEILSGVFEGRTTGTPIALTIVNQNQKSADYQTIADQFRPGHADFTYIAKYGIRDHRGGGRSSARETAMRVAAGAVARKVLGTKVLLRGALVAMGGDEIDRVAWDWNEVHRNEVFSPDPAAAARWTERLIAARKSGNSLGAVVEIRVDGVAAGLGAPIYGKLDADIASALMGINAVKGVEIGDGFAAAGLTGEGNGDEMRSGPDGSVSFLSNHAGGVLGGISTGQPIIARFAVKPTSSILVERRSVDRFGNEIDVVTRGRHDPCVGIRAVPVGEAMMACVLADHLLRHRAQNPGL